MWSWLRGREVVFAKRVRISEELKGGNAAVASESAELGVGEHLALDNIIQKHRTSWYLRPSFCCGGSQAMMKNASSCFSLYLQSEHLPEMSLYVVRHTGFWLWWQFLQPFLQVI